MDLAATPTSCIQYFGFGFPSEPQEMQQLQEKLHLLACAELRGSASLEHILAKSELGFYEFRVLVAMLPSPFKKPQFRVATKWRRSRARRAICGTAQMGTQEQHVRDLGCRGRLRRRHRTVPRADGTPIVLSLMKGTRKKHCFKDSSTQGQDRAKRIVVN